MSDQKSPVKVITSTTEALKTIKKMQFRRQIIPFIAVLSFLILNIFFTMEIFKYLTIASFGWFLFAKFFFRTKHKIAMPEAGAFVSPVDGKVISLRKGEDVTLLTIKKSWLDVVELRLCYPDLIHETPGLWSFQTSVGLIDVRIKAEKINWIEVKNESGQVAGIIPGNAVIVIHIPSGIEVLVSENQNIQGGETELFRI
jgi:hypothetical protein